MSPRRKVTADDVAAAAQAAQDAKEALEVAMVAYWQGGASQEAVGRAAGYTGAGVHHLLKRRGVA